MLTVSGTMIGYSEASTEIGILITVGLVLVLGALVTYLFSVGWKIHGASTTRDGTARLLIH
ncbi:MAG: hypothetical protein R3B69_02325 [Candidatus Paceibacterota bacterium]